MKRNGDLVLVVESDSSAAGLLTGGLLAAGYHVSAVGTGGDALARSAAEQPSVAIVELCLPDLDGVELCRRLRSTTAAAIIAVTAGCDEHRVVAALDAGADDHVTKPLSMPELLARVRVGLRHRAAMTAPTPVGVLEVGNLVIDPAKRQVSVGGVPVRLTPTEFEFLELLARHPGQVVYHQVLLRQVWGPAAVAHTEYLRVYAYQLRKKLGIWPGAPRLVTEAGVGFRLAVPG